MQSQKEAEVHNYYTRMAYCAGESFALDRNDLASANERLEEMDRVEVIELDQATFKYDKGLVDVFRAVEDPFRNELQEVSFEANPAEPSAPTTNIKFFEADGASNGAIGNLWPLSTSETSEQAKVCN